MSDFQPVIITAVIAVAVLSWALTCAFVIGLALRYRADSIADENNTTDETAYDTLSNVDCPLHGPDCEGWL